ncbi:tRNA synthetases class I (M)-domain-containing protein [Podospora didyma]|uniref:Probable methionine--tRNA ligase, mitochondrial n=1 Tax=Podospora didyma TaxID=330526 RepID=A0AAE0KJ71_9PEZI|nr:tRNA synthetases class I (M)-domain-containing protein [Podospora didyma]
MEALKVSSARGALRWHLPASRAWPRRSACRSCVRQIVASRGFATATTESPSSKPYYVTTPIFYVNAAPHVGHLYSMVLADVLKRWHVLGGQRAILCTGTDEHGIKVQQAAHLQSVNPKQLCDDNAAMFLNLAHKANIDCDRFIRTTDADHVDAVKHFWWLLNERGLIYESKHEGWYSVSDECFYTESAVEKCMDAFTGDVNMVSIETGSKVEWIEEKNYHFRMTTLKDKLLEFYKKNPNWVHPEPRMRQVVNWVQNNLEDLSISRPVSRLTWGIPVPDDESQTIYVWVDALINYITNAGFPGWTPGRETEGGWPADVHVIGKDIIRFHCVYWPALLLALDLPLPKRVLSHAHWTMDKTKMSKSLGNTVNPFFAIDRWGVDTMRFFLIYDGGIAEDADYNNERISQRYNSALKSRIGNLAQRVTMARQWNVRSAVKSVSLSRHRFKEAPRREMQLLFSAHDDSLSRLSAIPAECMKNLNPSQALRVIIHELAEADKFITATEPWAVVKDAEPLGRQQTVDMIIYLLAESLRIAGILLQPFMPEKATELLDLLGVATENRTLEHARPYCDFHYGKPIGVWATPGIKKQLFPNALLDESSPVPKTSRSGLIR